MNENEMWVHAWRAIAVALVCVVLITASCASNTHFQTRKALEAGIDPITVACAFGREGSMTACSISAAKK